MYILGISAFYHDSAAALIKNGEVIAAAQEERFTRVKQDSTFPMNAIRYCLEEAGIAIGEVASVVFYEIPEKKFKRLVKTYLASAPKGFASYRRAMPLWLSEKLYQKKIICEHLSQLGGFCKSRLMFTEHHLSHAASAFYLSPYEKAAILVIDGVGEDATTTIAEGSGNSITIKKQINFPHSLGMLYAAFTSYLGFKVNSGEYKVMGLAPYGRPKYVDLIFEKIVDLKDDGSFRLDQSYFEYATGISMTSVKFHELFEGPPRQPESEIHQKHFDIAASIQSAAEIIILAIVNELSKHDTTGNLCLAGGVALNCVANGKIIRDTEFKNLWVQPAAGDAGSAIGAALMAHYYEYRQDRSVDNINDKMKGCYLGPGFSQDQCEKELKAEGAIFSTFSAEQLIDDIVTALADEKVVGWFQGRMEFGPRALGNRSILGDPRSTAMQKTLNLKIKFRESFRPFAPSVLIDDVSEWFELDCNSPYMQLVAPIRDTIKIKMSEEQESLFGLDKLNVSRSSIPAVTHVDYTARIQTVHQDTNPLYYRLISKFKEKTGCPVLVNTSFNVRGEPIICTPQDAFRCFMTTDMDILVVERCVMYKEAQTAKVVQQHVFEPD